LVSVLALSLSRLILAPQNFNKLALSALALLLPIVPWLGGNFMLVTWLFFFALSSSGSATRKISALSPGCLLWLSPLLGYLAGSSIAELLSLFIGRGSGDIGALFGLPIDGLNRALDIIRAVCTVHLPSIFLLTRVFLFALVVELFTVYEKDSPNNVLETRALFLRSFKVGILISISYLFAQFSCRYIPPLSSVNLAIFSLPNQTPIWDSLGRLSGLFSDPNALGIALGLALWIYFLANWSGLEGHPRRDIGSWLPILIVVAGFISGSRSFIIACLALFILMACRRWRAQIVLLSLIFISFSSVVGVSMLDGLSGAVDYLVNLDGVPSGIKRFMSALSLLRVGETFMSRSVFLEFARDISDGFMLFGVGADRFIDYVPLVGAKLNLASGWRDNSNNFFVGIICELGWVGLSAFIAAIAGRRIASGVNRAHAVAALLVLSLLGCTGPHTDFIEVLILLGFIVGITTEPRNTRGMRALFGAGVVCLVCLGFISARFREQGVYPWGVHGEEDSREVSRWLSHRSIVALRCSAAERVKGLKIRARYIPQREPLRVKFGVFGGLLDEGSTGEVLLTGPEPVEIPVRCTTGGSRFISHEFIWLRVYPAWSPYRAWPGRSGDRRVLGVEQVE
jgi:hypothetical protein